MDGKRTVSPVGSAMMRSLRYFGKSTLQGIGISAAAAVVMMLFWGLGIVEYTGDMRGMMEEIFSLYSWYLLIAGGFVIVMLCINYFQVYFPVLLSMNATRKTIVIGILLSIAGMILGILLLAALLWKLAPGDVADGGIFLLPLIAGVYLIGSACFLVVGVVFSRWGKLGWILFFALALLIGVLITVIMMKQGNVTMIMMEVETFPQSDGAAWPGGRAAGVFRTVIAAGILLYLAAGAFVFAVTRKQEVRV